MGTSICVCLNGVAFTLHLHKISGNRYDKNFHRDEIPAGAMASIQIPSDCSGGLGRSFVSIATIETKLLPRSFVSVATVSIATTPSTLRLSASAF